MKKELFGKKTIFLLFDHKMMVRFTTTIKKFAQQGEKTGWTYIEIPDVIAKELNPGSRKSFRVKGKLDNLEIEGIALIPMGGGHFIMALNADLRKSLFKPKGSLLEVCLEKMIDD